MSKLGAEKFISLLVYSGMHMGFMYTYNGSKRKNYFNNDVYYNKKIIVSKFGHLGETLGVFVIVLMFEVPHTD